MSTASLRVRRRLSKLQKQMALCEVEIGTEEVNSLLVGADSVGGDAVVSSVVVGVDVNNA